MRWKHYSVPIPVQFEYSTQTINFIFWEDAYVKLVFAQ